jgi:bifunctional DNA-binding transcriptional regulator/antitoxin component of YhaV-PrlF toxin-antitoxin module
VSGLDILRSHEHNVIMARKMWRHRVTAAGQVSLPAEVRHRWATGAVVIEDEGDRIVLRPAADPLEELRGVLKDAVRSPLSGAEAHDRWRAEDNEALDRKWREHQEP